MAQAKSLKLPDVTPFGELLHALDLRQVDVAGELKIKASFVSMLSSGAATPSLYLSLQIDDWARGYRRRCTPESWRPWLDAKS